MARSAMVAVVLATGLMPAWAAAQATGSGPEPAVAEAHGASPSVYETMVRHPEVFRARLEESFRRLLGTPEKMVVEYEASRISDRLGGRFRRIAVAFEGGAIDTLRIESARLEALDVSYDLEALLAGKTFVPRAVGSTRIDLAVSEEALNIAAQGSKGRLGVENPRFDLRQGEIVFSGRIKLLFMKNQLRLVGKLETAKGSQIHFRPSDIEVSRLSLPGFFVSALARRFNPVVDLSRAAFWKTFKAQLGPLEITPGMLRLRTDPAPGEPGPEAALPPLLAEEARPEIMRDGPAAAQVPEPVLHSGAEPETL